MLDDSNGMDTRYAKEIERKGKGKKKKKKKKRDFFFLNFWALTSCCSFLCKLDNSNGIKTMMYVRRPVLSIRSMQPVRLTLAAI